jgi:hypothetical protein
MPRSSESARSAAFASTSSIVRRRISSMAITGPMPAYLSER